ncbi:MAG: aminopeptidase P family protein [Candidatus Aminicenantes bacterium]|nr:aminopeptidase P family protein [Candidatus Aminicenantes bacterium]
MFDPKIYIQRRNKLKKQLKSGIALFLGNEESPMNYRDNPFHFRQDSNFLYFFGLDSPGLAGIIDIDEGKDIIFGNDIDVEDIIWMGDLPKLKDRASEAGVNHTMPYAELDNILKTAISKGKKVHFLPPYRMENTVKLSRLLGLHEAVVNLYASIELIRAVVEQRSIKMKEEIDEIEKAHNIAYEMHTTAMKMTKPGIYEYEIAGKIEGIAAAMGGMISFPIILTINGQTLHNHYHGNKLVEGRLLVNDSGAESSRHYSSDITRTIPVSGKFSSKQKEIYNIVLDAQESAIKVMKPGYKNKNTHFVAVKKIAKGLSELGLMKGNIEEAVKAGAHALFMPHGLGHMMGLDVHDMEDLGENYVGYDEKTKRSDQFGLAYLRMAKELEPGHVLTVEPGIYFIPALIDQWKKEKRHLAFIDYSKVDKYRDFGGIRIEDNILITKTGSRVIGKTIPKTIDDVEAITGTY